MIVTIAREYGAAGLAVAQGVAEALGYGLVADDLPRTVASALGASPDEVASRAAAEPSLVERMLRTLGSGTPEALAPGEPRGPEDFDDSVRREIERTLRERALAGDVVILGRNAGAVLGARPGVLRVFLHGEREWRLARVVASFGQPRAAALADLERIDAARKRFAADRYGVRWGSRADFDLVVDVSRIGVEAAIASVAACARAIARG